jgi:hypothetical protein
MLCAFLLLRLHANFKLLQFAHIILLVIGLMSNKKSQSHNKPNMKLNVGTITGKSFLVDVENTDTIRDVKRIIEEEEDIPTDAQILIFKEKALSDGAVVSDLGLQDGSKLQLTVQMTGGTMANTLLVKIEALTKTLTLLECLYVSVYVYLNKGPGPLTKTRRTPLKRDDSVVLLLCQQSDGLYMLEFNVKDARGAGRPGAVNRIYKLSKSLQNMVLGHELASGQDELQPANEFAEQFHRYRAEAEAAMGYGEATTSEEHESYRKGVTTRSLSSGESKNGRRRHLTTNFHPHNDSAKLATSRPGSGDSQSSTLSFLSSISSAHSQYQPNMIETDDLSDSSSIITDLSACEGDIPDSYEDSSLYDSPNIEEIRNQLLHFASMLPPSRPLQSFMPVGEDTLQDLTSEVSNDRNISSATVRSINVVSPSKKSRPATAISIMRIPGLVNHILTSSTGISRPATARNESCKIRPRSVKANLKRSDATGIESNGAKQLSTSQKLSTSASSVRPRSVKFREPSSDRANNQVYSKTQSLDVSQSKFAPSLPNQNASIPSARTTSVEKGRHSSARSNNSGSSRSTTSLARTRLKSSSGSINSREKSLNKRTPTLPTLNANTNSNGPINCHQCQKKLRLSTSFKCKCNQTFCSLHRYSDRHKCSFDYKAAARDTLAKDNPKVVARKVQDI